MIGHNLITKQTGAEGKPCNAVYICERKYARREYYFAILMDRQSAGPVLVASSEGGMDIETVAKENPDAIVKLPVDIKKGLAFEDAKELAKKIGISNVAQEDAAHTFMNLYKLFTERDATQVEINPLSETNDHQGKETTGKDGVCEKGAHHPLLVFLFVLYASCHLPSPLYGC
jgi:succinyl-CoA synthetase beta subunit